MSRHVEQTDAQGGHLSPTSTYLKVGAALLTLTVLTVAISRINLGPWNLVVAMLIASVKAVLVVLFFMHLLHDNKIYGSFFAGALVFLSVLIILTMFDTMDRGDLHAEEAAPIRARAVIYGDDGKPLKKNIHEEKGASEEQHENAAADTTAAEKSIDSTD
jgi:cytochrome c oxidase subunit 4